ncbi:MAG TPA: AMP-binding protein [Acidimicrobiales bacterium]|nr:AMP-binding protein [Acidimicrobiales bacterium]
MRTIPAFFRAAVAAVPDKPWLFADAGEWTYAEAQHAVERGAAALRELGVRAGDRVLTTSANTAEYLFAWLALMEVGAVQVPVNPASTPAELAGFVAQVAPALVVTDPTLSFEGTRTAMVHDLFQAEADGRGPASVDPDDVAVMIPTSGTTGRSKLVMQTHRAYVMAGEGFPHWLRLTADDRLAVVLPLFHINAPAYSALGSVAARAQLALLPRFSTSGFLDDVRRVGATQFNAIGAMLELLMRRPAKDDDADNPLRRCYAGPAPTSERHIDIETRFGFEIVGGYGMSETPYGMVWPHGARPYGSLGAPRQHPELGDVNEARVAADGELELRNPAVMRGYYGMPEETAAAFTDDGWLRTGDLVRTDDDGMYWFLGRKKDVIRRRGENLSPLEVEQALQRHPHVALAAVVAVPSDLSEDDVKAFVVPVAGVALDVADVHAFAAVALARFKVPRYFEVVDELPQTPTGRVAKHRLPTERTAEEVDMEERR